MSRYKSTGIRTAQREAPRPKNSFVLLLDEEHGHSTDDEKSPRDKTSTKAGNIPCSSSSSSNNNTTSRINLLLLPDSILVLIIIPHLDDTSAVNFIRTHHFTMRFSSAYHLKSEVEYRLVKQLPDIYSNDDTLAVVVSQDVIFPFLAQQHTIKYLEYVDPCSYQLPTYSFASGGRPVRRIGVPTRIRLTQTESRLQNDRVQDRSTKESENTQKEKQVTTYEKLDVWRAKVWDYLPATIESLRIASDLCTVDLPSLARFTRLHTLEFDTTLPKFFTLPPGSFPPNLHTLKYSDDRDFRKFKLERLQVTQWPLPDAVYFPPTLTELYLPPIVFSSPPYRNDSNVLTLPPQLRVLHYCGQTHSLANWILPESLTELRLGDAFNDDSLDEWTPPKGLQTLIFGDTFNRDVSHAKWPANLSKVVFGRDFAQSLLSVNFPSSLTHLEITPGEGSYLSRGEALFGRLRPGDDQSTVPTMILPPALETLIFPSARHAMLMYDSHYGGYMKALEYPPTLTHLELGARRHTDYSTVRWSSSIRSLQLSGAHFMLTRNFPLPKQLEVLDISESQFGAMNPSLFLTLPSTLRELILPNELDNSSIEQITLPNRLEKLTFGHMFNRSLKKVRLPSGLTYLKLGRDWNQNCSKLPTLPNGLRTLILGENFSKFSRSILTIEGLKLPESLRYLSLGRHFELQDMSQLALPAGLRELHFASSSVEHNVMKGVKLPPYCRVIQTCD